MVAPTNTKPVVVGDRAAQVGGSGRRARGESEYGAQVSECRSPCGFALLYINRDQLPAGAATQGILMVPERTDATC